MALWPNDFLNVLKHMVILNLLHSIIHAITVILFVCTEAYHPRQQVFSQVGTEPTLPGFNQYFRELMCLAQGRNTVTPVGIEPRTSRFRV